MRTIKFRGRDADDGEWLYGDLRQRMGYFPTIIEPYCDDGGKVAYREIAVEEKTVGQFTNMKDKKDQEIYDGDILFVEFSDKSGGYYFVGWNEKTASWGIMDAYSYQALQEGYDFPEFKNYLLLAFLEKAIIFEVAGNSYDNPELLELRKKN